MVTLLASRPHEAFPLAAIARYLGVAKATCLPMLNSLVASGWLLRHPTGRTYRLGPALVEIGLAAHRAAPIDGLRPTLIELADEADAMAIVWQPSDAQLVLTEILDGTGERPCWSGLTRGHRIHPVAPLGACLFAWSTPHEIDAWLATADPVDPDASRCRMLPALAHIRRHRYAVERMLPATHDLFQLIEHTKAAGSDGLDPILETIERRLQRELVDVDYLVADLRPSERYDLVSVNSPVFGPFGEVEMILCVVDLPAGLTGTEVERIAGRVRDLADATTAAGGGVRPDLRPTG